MQQRSDAHHSTTGDPQVTVLDTLRSVGIPTEPIRIVQPLTAVKPRPKPPARPLSTTPISHDLPDYEVTPAPKTTATAKAKAVAEYAPPGALLSRDLVFHPEVQGPVDRYDGHHHQQAFGGAA